MSKYPYMLKSFRTEMFVALCVAVFGAIMVVIGILFYGIGHPVFILGVVLLVVGFFFSAYFIFVRWLRRRAKPKGILEKDGLKIIIDE